MAMSAAVICGRSGGPSNRRSGDSTTSKVEAPSRASRRSSASFHPKWCIPGGVMAAGDGGSIPVERTKDLMAFLFSVLGSFV